MTVKDFSSFVEQNKKRTDEALEGIITNLDSPQVIKDSMLYSLKAGGKRIRPLLVYATLNAFGKEEHLGVFAACAIEMIHTYSLIHDDLPAMDNDDLRRGMPTNHIMFGEDMAILAGDALLTHSFTVLAKGQEAPSVLVELIGEISSAAGPEGMVAGQVLDMLAENQKLNLDELKKVHIYKTGKMIMGSILSGAIIAGATPEIKEKLRQFSILIGLAFQIQDDILDFSGDEEKLGKPIGSDATNQKSTYVSLFSIEKANDYLQKTFDEALSILNSLPIDSAYLQDICKWIVSRDS